MTNLTWILFDLRKNKITSVDFGEIEVNEEYELILDLRDNENESESLDGEYYYS